MATKAEYIATEKKRRLIGNNLLISVGINKYANPDDCLNNCESDAQQVYLAFKETKSLGMHPASIMILSKDDGSSTSKETLLNTISDTVKKVENNTNIVFFYSGHGCRSGNQFCFVVSDAMITKDELTNCLFEAIGEKQVSISIIVDACQTIDNNTKSLDGKSDKYVFAYLKNSLGIGTIYSCKKGEYSLDVFNDKCVSVFTSFLLDALKGYSEALDGGYLTFDSMYKYIEEASFKASRECTQISQHPVREFEGNEIFYGYFDKESINHTTPQHLIFSFSDKIEEVILDLNTSLDRLASECGIIPFSREDEDTYSLMYALQAYKMFSTDYNNDLPEIFSGWEELLYSLFYYKDMIGKNVEFQLSLPEMREFLEKVENLVAFVNMVSKAN